MKRLVPLTYAIDTGDEIVHIGEGEPGSYDFREDQPLTESSGPTPCWAWTRMDAPPSY